MEGWGAHLSVHTASGLWDETQSSWHINALELEAVFLGLQSFLSLVRDKHVQVRTDNTTVAAYINRQGGSRSLTLSARACQILVWCSQHRILLSAKYFPGSLNVLADSLSRSSQVIHTEWTLTHQVIQRLWLRFGKPMVDLFATRFSRRLPFPDPEAWETNALEIEWSGLVAYAFPPFHLLSKVLRKADLEKPCLLLVAPWWPSQQWFPDLLRLADGPLFPLDVKRGDLVQPRSGVPHENPQSLRLHAWKLSGSLCVAPAPQKLL
ncbi:hypothetical protein V1264_014151 [Littorina saxatilis]|uniref:Uncharacterized protein n=1 Tax=Littorina saxatilis TaxID=31220 RepID=A0AAN9BS50_9CAEN